MNAITFQTRHMKLTLQHHISNKFLIWENDSRGNMLVHIVIDNVDGTIFPLLTSPSKGTVVETASTLKENSVCCESCSLWICRICTPGPFRYCQCVFRWFNSDSCSWSNQFHSGDNRRDDSGCNTIQCDLCSDTVSDNLSHSLLNLNYGTDILCECQGGTSTRVAQIRSVVNWKFCSRFSDWITFAAVFIFTLNCKICWSKTGSGRITLNCPRSFSTSSGDSG